MINKGFKDFLLWEATTRDSVDFKTVYVDLADDLLAGLLLSQIVYWYLPNKKGESKLRIYRDGHYWIAKGRSDWWDEIRLKPRQVDRAIAILIEKGLIATALYKFSGAPTTHIRLLQEAFMVAWQMVIEARESLSPDRQMELTDSLKPSSPNGQMDLFQSGNSLTETTAETTAETTDRSVPVGENSCLSPEQQRVRGLQARFGTGPLAVMAHCAGAQEGKAHDRPKGWEDTPQDVFEVCRRVAKHWTGNHIPSGLYGDRSEIWKAHAAELLRQCGGDIARTLEMLDRYHLYWQDNGQPFTISSPKSLVGVLPAFIASGGHGNRQERRSQRQRSSRDGDWPTDAECDSVWSVHGDWLIEFFETKREEIVDQFGDGSYLNPAVYSSQIAEALSLSRCQALALLTAYARWDVARLPAVDVRQCLGEGA